MQKTISVNSVNYTVTLEPHGDVFIELASDPEKYIGGRANNWDSLLYDVVVVDPAYVQKGYVVWDLYVWDNASSVIERLEDMFNI